MSSTRRVKGIYLLLVLLLLVELLSFNLYFFKIFLNDFQLLFNDR